MEPKHLLTRTAALHQGTTDAQLRSKRLGGELRSVARGTYVNEAEWNDLSEREQYRLRVVAASSVRAGVVSHGSAAALLDMPVLRPGRKWVHTTVPGSGGGKKTETSYVHRSPLTDDDIVVVDGISVTSPARTALDLACAGPFDQGVCAVESAMRLGATNFDAVLSRMGRRTGIATARRSIELASPLSESIGESWSRVQMSEWPEIPMPRQQHEFRTAAGIFVARTDFDWDGKMVGEFDGLVKYDARSALIDEKLRQDALTALGIHVVRWTWRDLMVHGRLRQILAAGFALVR